MVKKGVERMRKRWLLGLTAVLCFLSSFIFTFWFVQNADFFMASLPQEQNSFVPPQVDSPEESLSVKTTYIGIYGNRLAVFIGKPETGILREITDLTIEKIPEYEIKNLRSGILFSGEAEKYSILEGLHFPH